MGRIPICLKILAAVALLLGRPERAATLGAAAERCNDEFGGELAEVFGHLADPVGEARPQLGAEARARAAEHGRTISLDDLIAFALEEPSRPEAGVRGEGAAPSRSD